MNKYYFFLLLIGSLISCKQEPKSDVVDTSEKTTLTDTTPVAPSTGMTARSSANKPIAQKVEDIKIGLPVPQINDAIVQEFMNNYEVFITEFNLAANKNDKAKCIEMGKKVEAMNKDAYAMTAKLSGDDQQKTQEYFDSKSHYLLLLMTSTR